ncbi:MAG: hypothetical protein H6620_12095 [Halobacteriovoraceae bacterium]|nr:hypothetical protein [Halobacteriovoraceae bacterium]
MKFLISFIVLFLFITNLALAQKPLIEIDLNNPIQVNDINILQAANFAMKSAVYWEDQGYEFKALEDSNDIQITKIFKDDDHVSQKLELNGTIRTGGFGWHHGYQEGTASCVITLIKENGDYLLKHSHSYADCDIELDDE